MKRSDLPYKYDMAIVTGDDFIGPKVTHKNPDGTAVDLTGATIVGKVRAEANEDAAVLASFTFTRDDTAGEYTPEIAAAVTATLAGYRVLHYDIEITDTLGKKTTYLAGSIIVKRSTT